jgi:hypothetical protein
MWTADTHTIRTRKDFRSASRSGTTGQGRYFGKGMALYGEKWSRQSEELPLHRVIDLAILLCRAKLYFREAYRFPKFYQPENPQIDRIGLQGDAMNVSVCTDNPMIDEDIQMFYDVLGKDDELLSERLRILSGLLKEMDY